MTKTISLVDHKKKAEPKRLTYKDILEAHINLLSEEQANSYPESLVLVASILDLGSVYSVLEGDDVTQVVGMLEVAKTFIISESLTEEYV